MGTAENEKFMNLEEIYEKKGIKSRLLSDQGYHISSSSDIFNYYRIRTILTKGKIVSRYQLALSYSILLKGIYPFK
uniref:Uncharacterized protein n=1 Tax=Onchocerca volvulus TaxID=6282 RepID=A0A8R1TS33_ONCVO